MVFLFIWIDEKMVRRINDIKKLCVPLTRLKPFVKAIWLYGSAVRKKGFKKTSDIDILILIDDTRKIKDEFLRILRAMTDAITKQAEKKKLKLHFQPPKLLTLWWDLIRKGEPWALTSLQNPVVIYDPSDYIKLLSSLLNKGKLYNAPEKSERLLERAKEKIGEIRQISLFKVPEEILQAMSESAQIALMYLGIFPPSPKDVSRELRKHFSGMINETLLGHYDEIYTAVRKINRGHMTELAGREIDTMINNAKQFITRMEAILIELEERKTSGEILNGYKECLVLCEKTLRNHGYNHSASEQEKLDYFKKYCVDTGEVSLEHYSILKGLADYKKAGKEEREKIETHLTPVKIESLKLALRDALRRKK